MTNFIHLKIHTEYSLVDSIINIDQLMSTVAQHGMFAVALTDYNNLFAAIKFYQQSRQHGIKPIIGADLGLFNPSLPQISCRFTVLCQNLTGYHNLLQLVSLSFTDGQKYGTPTIKHEWLSDLNDGLIILSGAEDGDIGKALLSEDTTLLEQSYDFWQRNFPERFYLEVKRIGLPQEELYIAKTLDFATTHGLPLIATNEVRFLHPDDFEAHEARVCIHQGSLLTDTKRNKLYTPQQYLRSTAEMTTLFADLPDALENTAEIAKRCNVEIPLGQYFFPQYPLPEKSSAEEILIATAHDGLKQRLQENNLHYTQRLNHELTVINQMGFAGYFLIVADFVSWAKNNQVPVGPGRGSGVGSLVAYSLKITDLDPLKYNLLFERFLNPERVSLPDFDIDFCIIGRDRVIDYVIKKYGKSSVAQIMTYGTMTAKAVVRDVGRVLGLPYNMVDKLAKLIPLTLGITLPQALKQEPLLQQRYKQDDEVKTLIDLALKLEGLKRNPGTHAGGIVIAPGNLSNFAPLYCEATNAHLVTQFDKDDVEAVGLVKFDFLGLKTLTIIANTLETINSQHKQPINIDNLDTNDQQTFKLLQSCNTIAIFQLESRGMQDLVRRMQPDCFSDIVALVALFRPGPLQSGMVDDFINRKHNQATVSYPHPKLESILQETYGVILYQEQVMQIAQVLAGYSLGAADLLRRAMGKKKASAMQKQRSTFCDGAAQNQVDATTANYIFDLMEKFSGYGFNKSHAAAYALISYQTAWLKTHYPAAFMAAVLSADMGNTDKVVLYLADCKKLGIEVLAPDINTSNYNFTLLNDKCLIYGLGAIKGVGESAIEHILSVRNKSGKFSDLFSFCAQIASNKINRRCLEALIKSGACDSMLPDRASLLASLPLALQYANQYATRNQSLQRDLFAKLELPPDDPQYVMAQPWTQQQILQAEKSTLGFYLSSHPIKQYLTELRAIISCRISEAQEQSIKNCTIAGLITHIRYINTKKHQKMAVVTLDDEGSTIEVTLFSETLQQHQPLLQVEQIIIVNGELNLDPYTEKYRILAKKIDSLDTIRKDKAKTIELAIHSENTHILPNLLETLTKHRPGKTPIKIKYYSNNKHLANLQPDHNWRVTISDHLIMTLQELLGENMIKIIY